MRRPLTAIPALFLAPLLSSSLACAASHQNEFSPAQRQEVVQILRQALKDDPSILGDAIVSLKSKAQEQQRSETAHQLNDQKDALEHAPTYAVRGNPHGDVTIVEFFDPRCGYCKRAIPIIDSILEKDKNIRFVEKIVPVLSDKSVTISRAIIAASLQGGYDKMKRTLMADNATPTDAYLRNMAKQNGLDAERLIKDMSRQEVIATIQSNLDQARDIDLSGTPTFIFNHKTVIPGYVSENDILREVRALRKK